MDLNINTDTTFGEIRKALILRFFVPMVVFLPFFFLPFDPVAFFIAIIANRWIASSIECSYRREIMVFHAMLLDKQNQEKNKNG